MNKIYTPDTSTQIERPLCLSAVETGFPSLATDYMEEPLDINQHLIKHSAATFFVRASGDSMIGAGIHDGDLMIVDRSLEARNRKIVIAVVRGFQPWSPLRE